MDGKYYPDPHKYDPWRFSRVREELTLKSERSSPTPPNPLITISPTTNPTAAIYLLARTASRHLDSAKNLGTLLISPFCDSSFASSHHFLINYGNNPTRHIVRGAGSHPTYIALHYEIAPIKVRPQNTNVGDCIVAPSHGRSR